VLIRSHDSATHLNIKYSLHKIQFLKIFIGLHKHELKNQGYGIVHKAYAVEAVNLNYPLTLLEVECFGDKYLEKHLHRSEKNLSP
jgi:hypothetical protein